MKVLWCNTCNMEICYFNKDSCGMHDLEEVEVKDTIKLELSILFGILAFIIIFIGVSVWRVM